jgi:ribosome-associated protein
MPKPRSSSSSTKKPAPAKRSAGKSAAGKTGAQKAAKPRARRKAPRANTRAGLKKLAIEAANAAGQAEAKGAGRKKRGPKQEAAPPAPPPESPALKSAQLAADAALDKKAEDVRVVDLRGRASYADFLVVCSGQSDRQLDAIAESIEKALKDSGQRMIGSEGRQGGRWLLLDFEDVVVHVFHQEERPHYDLEGLWADAPQRAVAAGPERATQPQPG